MGLWLLFFAWFLGHDSHVSSIYLLFFFNEKKLALGLFHKLLLGIVLLFCAIGYYKLLTRKLMENILVQGF
jgi:hypothetical protein